MRTMWWERRQAVVRATMAGTPAVLGTALMVGTVRMAVALSQGGVVVGSCLRFQTRGFPRGQGQASPTVVWLPLRR